MHADLVRTPREREDNRLMARECSLSNYLYWPTLLIMRIQCSLLWQIVSIWSFRNSFSASAKWTKYTKVQPDHSSWNFWGHTVPTWFFGHSRTISPHQASWYVDFLLCQSRFQPCYNPMVDEYNHQSHVRTDIGQGISQYSIAVWRLSKQQYIRTCNVCFKCPI